MKNSDIKTILVPIDFSKLSTVAIETAKKLARRFEATIHFVHVHELPYPVVFMAPGTIAPMSLPAYREDAAKRLGRDLKALAKEHDLSGENCHVRQGAPAFDEICRLAGEISADLIVTATHGYTGITRVLEGSTAERLVQHSPCPVVVGRRREKKSGGVSSNGKSGDTIDNILVPVDFSQCSFQALEYAIEFATRVAARLTIFHAVHLGCAPTANAYAMYDLSAPTESARKEAERRMEQLVQFAKFRRVQFETVIKVGPPVSEICDFADQRDVDLIVTATHGRTGFKHLMIGSAAEQIVRHARRPVLVVPSHPEMRAASLTEGAQEKSKAARASIPRAARETNKFRESHSKHELIAN